MPCKSADYKRCTKGHCRNCPDHIKSDATKIIMKRTTDELLKVVDGVDERYSKEFQMQYFGRLDWKQRLEADRRVRRKKGGVGNASKVQNGLPGKDGTSEPGA